MSPNRRPDVGARRLAARGLAATCAALACVVAISTGVASAATLTGGRGAVRPAPTTTTTTVPDADAALARLMLSTTLPRFALAPPGPRNGPLSADALATFLGSPESTERVFDALAAEPGFASWVKTWQDPLGVYVVHELAFRFHRSAEATLMAGRFIAVFGAGAGSAGALPAPGIPGGRAFVIAEPGRTAGTVDIPPQQVREVVFTAGDYLAVIETDAQTLPGAGVVPAGAASQLAQTQYRTLAQAGAAGAPGLPAGGGGGDWTGTALEVTGGVVVAAVVAGVVQRRRLVLRRRRRRAELRRAAMTRHASAMGPVVRATAAARPAANGAAAPAAAPATATAPLVSPAAGWYTDPTDPDKRRIRYWNGSAWTTHVAEPAG